MAESTDIKIKTELSHCIAVVKLTTNLEPDQRMVFHGKRLGKETTLTATIPWKTKTSSWTEVNEEWAMFIIKKIEPGLNRLIDDGRIKLEILKLITTLEDYESWKQEQLENKKKENIKTEVKKKNGNNRRSK